MACYSIAVIPGDGIGPEVIPAARSVLLEAARKFGFELRFEEFGWGAEHYFRSGSMAPPEFLEILRPFDAILLGAVGHPEIPDHVTLQGLLLPIRRAFDQYANVRPAVLYPGVEGPLKGRGPGEIDLVIVRENTEGEYAPVGGFLHERHPEAIAVQAAVFTRRGCERVIRYAFQLAVRRNRKRCVTSVTKSNAQAYGMVLWDRVFREVAAEFPDIRTESLLVDAAAMNFVRRPETFDVVVASNLFGDILSDLAAAVTGSIGLAPSANLDPERRYPSMFEPVHGSAPDIAGRGVANPVAAILSGAMMLEHLGQTQAARAIEEAVAAVLAEGRVRTPDLGGRSTTGDVAAAVVERLGRP
ncbi:MAG TPA: tartrate dehydrogenase [Bryobacteraceae bacterium]|nr:tartrate dehydrogenase [Bryobacteraceae bacterium]